MIDVRRPQAYPVHQHTVRRKAAEPVQLRQLRLRDRIRTLGQVDHPRLARNRKRRQAPLTFYVANLASTLPALFPTESRYGAMGIAYNFAVAIFGGTAPFIIASRSLPPATALGASRAKRVRVSGSTRRTRGSVPALWRPGTRQRVEITSA